MMCANTDTRLRSEDGARGMIFGQQRDQIRRVFVDVWRKVGEGALLETLQRSIAAVIKAHPEYQRVLADADAVSRDYPVESE